MIDPIALAKGFAGGGAAALTPIVVMYYWAVPVETYNRHVAENERGFVLDVVGKAAAVEPGPYKDTLCRTLEEAIGRLCSAQPSDSICMDREAFREQAGC